jgi:hypothetical protein
MKRSRIRTSSQLEPEMTMGDVHSAQTTKRRCRRFLAHPHTIAPVE